MATSNRPPSGGTCPRCLGRVEQNSIEAYCGDCGLVTEDSPVDRGPDWGYYDKHGDTDPGRAAPGNRNMADRGLGTETETGHDRRDRIDRHTSLGSRRDKTRAYATTEIARMTSALELPRYVGARAKRVFRDLYGATSLEGQDVDAVTGACLYAACREEQLGRTAEDIATLARADERPITRRLWWVADEIGLEIPPPDVRQRTRVVGYRVGLSDAAVDRAVELVGDVDSRASPSVLAAWACWQASHRTQADVADVAGVSRRAIQGV
jgi:transcription initiation factor TFIIB